MKKGGKKKSRAEEDESDQYDDDIDAFHKQKEKVRMAVLDLSERPIFCILLADKSGFDRDSSEEEEVLNVAEDSDSDDEDIAAYKQQLRQINRNKFKKKLDSDLEEEAEEYDDLPDAKAWGAKRSWFQGGDVRDNRIGMQMYNCLNSLALKMRRAWQHLEEKESLAIQQRLAAQLDEDDFGIAQLVQLLLASDSTQLTPDSHTLFRDLLVHKILDVRKRAIRRSERCYKSQGGFFKDVQKGGIGASEKDIPEFFPLVKDFREKMLELKEKVLPLMELVKSGKIVDNEADYVRSKFHILMGYLTNGCFYMYLMAKRTPVHDHPVMKRLAQFRQLAKMMEPLDDQVAGDIEKLLEKLKQGEDVDLSVRPQKKRKIVSISNESPVPAMEDNEEDIEMEDQEDGKRGITYQIEKNKGITTYKKKELRNPRVKHRMKYRKANIRHKVQVQKIRPKGYYDGEHAGIRAGIIRSRKMK
ncbi:something about silencing protein 10-like [Pomacea canaliculata]|uniref:something about silencing protein 10-like n=1 Tax=Pomacea canaliculata TaxID=400727 RepID=UPI000D72C420|nr:something about silencing protein 10-like [Pomacea canaliculata]